MRSQHGSTYLLDWNYTSFMPDTSSRLLSIILPIGNYQWLSISICISLFLVKDINFLSWGFQKIVKFQLEWPSNLGFVTKTRYTFCSVSQGLGIWTFSHSCFFECRANNYHYRIFLLYVPIRTNRNVYSIFLPDSISHHSSIFSLVIFVATMLHEIIQSLMVPPTCCNFLHLLNSLSPWTLFTFQKQIITSLISF